jgi:hypothetical protein
MTIIAVFESTLCYPVLCKLHAEKSVPGPPSQFTQEVTLVISVPEAVCSNFRRSMDYTG